MIGGNNEFGAKRVKKKKIVFDSKKNSDQNILFSDIDYVYVRLYRLPVYYEYFLVFFSFVYTVVSILFLELTVLLLLPVLLIILFYIRIKKIRKYGVMVYRK